MNNSIRFVPFSVKMRSAGFVRNPVHSWSLSVPKWIPAPAKVDMVAVDRTVNILARFVAKWVAQSRQARREYRIREAGRKWRDAALQPNWADLSEAHERREVIRARQQFEAWCTMPEDQWRAIARNMIAAVRDIGPLIRDVLKPVWEERDRRAAVAAIEAAQKQLIKKPVRPRNRYDIGSDSE